MEYTVSIDIDLPRDQVVKLFDNPDNLRHWQEGFISYEPLTGTFGAVGSTTSLRYHVSGRDVELIETLTSSDLPDAFSAIYETNGIWNHNHNRFEVISPQRTRWVTRSEYRFTNFMMKVIGLLMPGGFKKQSLTFMKNFKAFAEQGTSVVS